jgi:hypothetical protein
MPARTDSWSRVLPWPAGSVNVTVQDQCWPSVGSTPGSSSPLMPYRYSASTPVRNYLAALAGSAGVEPARDFALGVLTERVRQEENGWPDQPGDPRGRRTGHGTGPSHSCLLERKHQVEDAIYDTLPSTAPG